MGEKIIVGPINKGFKNDRTAFVIDNDSFPTLINAYQWRGRVKRKRGTSLLGRLQRKVSFSGALNLNTNQSIILPNFPIVPGTVNFVGGTDGTTYTDPSLNGVLLATGGTGTGGLINYATGLLTITAGGGQVITGSFSYYPLLPVMGLEDLILGVNDFPKTLAFDTKYSYNITTTTPSSIYDVSYYKNISTGTTGYPGYTQKTNSTATSWNGEDYQQFWTVNYQGALWATNGINVPFDSAKVGMQYASSSTTPALTAATWVNATTMTFTVIGNPLVVGDFVYANEFTGGYGLNWQTGYVTVAGDTFTVVFPYTVITNAAYTVGMLQYLTNRSVETRDCIRWYDGDPTNAGTVTAGFTTGKGWVNFMPPLSQDNFSIADLPAAKYYLVGARMIVPFKDRLLFIGPVVQTSSVNSQVYLQDTVIFCQNGTPYYTASFTNPVSVPQVDNPTSPTINFRELLVPANQTATAPAYFADSTGFGGWISAGLDDPIISVSSNEDVLLMGFNKSQSRFVYTGNDLLPFNFFTINTEMGTSSTFSVINMDQGSITKGGRGYIITSQTQVQRIDLDIPDQVFEVGLLKNGNERVCAQRDFINEWIYFTYPTRQDPDALQDNKFPNQSLQYNYRDNSWGIFNECYTTYGSFRKTTGETWATIGLSFATWSVWDEPWNAGASTLLQPQVIAGNQQGFILFRNEGTNEANSLFIESISGSVVTSPNHTLNPGDFITISGALGTIGAEINNKIFSVGNPTTNAFTLNLPIGTGTYLGSGLIKRMYRPQIQTKQFPTAWGMGRKTRLGPQQYLLTKTSNAQVTLLIYLSQDSSNPFNDGGVWPDANAANDSLIYSTVLYTCPESTNLGLSKANTNLQMVTAGGQSQIWHRMNTSLLGDTVQIGFTLSDEQMRTVDDSGSPISQFAEIELHGFILDTNPSMWLS